VLSLHLVAASAPKVRSDRHGTGQCVGHPQKVGPVRLLRYWRLRHNTADTTTASPVIPSSDSTTGAIHEIDSRRMALQAYASHPIPQRIPRPVKAALYARVSTERQREEATIESQLFELKRQIAAAGHTLVKEYIDDGYSGAYLDRPALEEMRKALKSDTFDAVYFLCADRIARDASTRTSSSASSSSPRSASSSAARTTRRTPRTALPSRCSEPLPSSSAPRSPSA
jgi:resolvase-like protein